MLLLETDDGRLIEKEEPVQASCAVDDDTCQGYLLDGANQYQDEKTKIWYQIVDEKSTIPICLLQPERVEILSKLIDGIFHHSWTLDLAAMDRDAAKDRQKAMLYLLLGVAVIITCLILAVKAFK